LHPRAQRAGGCWPLCLPESLRQAQPCAKRRLAWTGRCWLRQL